MVTPEVGVAGAVYISVREFEPAAIVPPPLRLQVTDVAVEFDMTAVSVTVCVGKIALGLASAGEVTLTLTPGEGGTIPLPPLAQPLASARLSKAIPNRQFFIMMKSR
jgi:hypothetical protein